MHDSKIIKNYSYNLAYQVLSLIIPLITTPYLSRILGAEGIGVYGFTHANATYFVFLISAGINIYGQRTIAYLQDDIAAKVKAFREISVIKLVLGVVFGVVYLLLFAVGRLYSTTYRILFIEVLASAFDISWYFQGEDNFKIVTLRNISFRALGTACVFLFVKVKSDVGIYALCCTLPVLIGNLSLWFCLPQQRMGGKYALRISCHLKPMLLLFIPQIAIEVYTILDKSMLGLLSSSISEVGYYEQAQKIMKVALRFLTAMGTVVMSRNAHSFATADKNQLENNTKNSISFVLCIGMAITFGVVGIAEKLIPWFMGSGFDIVVLLIYCFAPAVLLIGISNTIGAQYLTATMQQNVMTYSVIAGACVNVVCNFCMIPTMGAMGATLGSLIAEATVTTIQIIAVRKQLPIKHYFDKSWKYLLAGLCMCALVVLVGKIMPTGALYTLIQVLCGLITYIAMLFILNDDFMKSVMMNIVMYNKSGTK